jgi:hypothetical protein
MSILNSFVNDIFERVAVEASKLAQYNKRSTISSREIQTSVRLILPGELAKHAVSEGTKAVTKFASILSLVFWFLRLLTLVALLVSDFEQVRTFFRPWLASDSAFIGVHIRQPPFLLYSVDAVMNGLLLSIFWFTTESFAFVRLARLGVESRRERSAQARAEIFVRAFCLASIEC